MEPTVSSGDYLLVNPRAYRHCPPQLGDLVIARHPLDSDVVITKRVAGVRKAGLELVSDNSQAGTDSRHFGLVPAPLVRGRVTCVIR